MITSRIPKSRRRVRVISRRVRPPTSTNALGRSLVRERRRVPKPAARIIAFIGLSFGCFLQLERRISYPGFLQFAMVHNDFNTIVAAQISGKLLGQIDGAVLAAGTAE